jgi:acetyltransferase-like isoleucine patch superfamily enzyme
MIHFRLRDWVSVLMYRLLAPFFGSLAKGARIVWPLRIYGARFLHLEAGATLQYGAYVAVLPKAGDVAELRIGAGTMIGNHAHLVCTSRIRFGRDVLVADRVFVADNGHVYADPTRPILAQGLEQLAEVDVGDGAWIGENVVIIGASVGRNAVIAANSVVTRDIPDRTVAAGAPAVPVRRWCEETSAWRRTAPDGSFLP